jgi:hypothetical protein
MEPISLILAALAAVAADKDRAARAVKNACDGLSILKGLSEILVAEQAIKILNSTRKPEKP